eukprot:COSAG06_NODE_613_length_13796_cov_45.631525_16_plen_83_part_00
MRFLTCFLRPSRQLPAAFLTRLIKANTKEIPFAAALRHLENAYTYFVPLYTENDHFTKTGSEQTQGKHSKKVRAPPSSYPAS